MAKVTVDIQAAGANKASADIKRLNKNIKSSGTSAAKSKAGMLKLAGGVTAAVVALGGLYKISKDLVSTYAVQEQAEARLEAVLRATGNAAGFTAGELKAHASALQQVTTYGDEAVIGAQSILATFKSIGGDVFKRTTETTLDLSAAFGQDLKSSAILLGKALEEPVSGLSALRRVGVTFSEQQKELIKNFAETGEVAKAQAVILSELETQVGGTAKALGDTATGAFQQYSNAIGDVKEELGLLISEAFEPLTRYATKVASEMSDGLKETRLLKDIMTDGTVADNLEDAVIQLQALNEEQEKQNALRSATVNPFFSSGPAKDYIGLIAKVEEQIESLNAEATKQDQERAQKQQAQVNKQRTQNAQAEAEKLKQQILSIQKADELFKLREAYAESTANIALLEKGIADGLFTTAEGERLITEQQEKRLELARQIRDSMGGRFSVGIDATGASSGLDMVEKETQSTLDKMQKSWSDYGQQIANSTLSAYSTISATAVSYAAAEIKQLQEKVDAYKASEDEKITAFIQSGMSVAEAEASYNAELEKLEQEKNKKTDEIKRAAFNADKASKAASAGINTAVGITQALATLPPPASFITAGLVGALGSAQVAAILAEKYQGLATGGIVPAQGKMGGLYRLGDEGKAEAVIPLDRYDKMNGNGGGGITNNYTFNVDGFTGTKEELGVAITEALERTQRTGRTE